MNSPKTAFALDKYHFSKINIDLSNIQDEDEISIAFEPSGVFNTETSIYDLAFIFKAKSSKAYDLFVEIECNASFSFSDTISIEDIPEYFYINSIAIIFPYVRAFVSTVTLQANVPPVVLPTMNLVSLGPTLKEKTIEK